MAKTSEATLLLRIKSAGEEVINKTGESLAALGKLGAAAFGVISTGVIASIAAYRESEEATNSLNQALINQGIYSKKLAKEYTDLASELQKTTTFSDDAIVSAQAQLQMYLGQTKITDKLTKSILDFAAAQKMDVVSAAEVVGKSIGTSTNALGRYGIQIEASASASEKMAAITKALGDRFGGQATAAANGLGSLEQMKIAMGDILEVVGEKLAPFITMVAKGITKLSQEISSNTTILDTFVESVQFLAKFGVVAKTVIFGLAEVISQQLGTAFGAISQAMNGQFKMAWESIRTMNHDSATIVTDRYKQMHEEIKAVDEAFNTRKGEEDAAENERLAQSSLRATQISQEKATAHALELEQRAQMNKAGYENELMNINQSEQMKNNVYLQYLNKRIETERDATEKHKLELERRAILEKEFTDQHAKTLSFRRQLEVFFNDARVTAAQDGLNHLVQLQNSKSKELAAIGKAAAIAQVGMDTAKGAMSAYSGMLTIPVVGPILAPIAAGAVIAYGAERIASISGIQLAEGGIVRSTPGGIQATIGEGGKDEAVIPLEDGMVPGMNGGINITVYGGLLGDQGQARDFAIAIDRELLKLRQSNQSVAFDSGVI